MSQKINISINKPCSEKFNSFSKTISGGHCKTCQENVTDFTKMSQKEIFNHFKNPNKNTCGYFSESQLKTYSDEIGSTVKQNTNWLDMIRVSSLLMFATTTNWGQNSGAVPTIEQHQMESKPKANKIEKNITNTPFVVRGKIIDENGLPMPGVSVTQYGGTISTSTDFTGNFVFPKELAEGDRLSINFLGYVNQIINVSKNEITIKMKEHEQMLMGKVSVKEIFVSKPSFFQRLKNIF
ncbi:carboxypeptidase-like regulatory domain-containing protein [Flavobacterium sp.]|uniref:carboxypeptidase-like regulatory domain-containing protein n=1 Tax=Flavobacterium sp. TaxID=239 RepID=UPI00375098AD